MIVFVNDKAEIHDVGTTNDPTLTGLFIKDEGNPFKDWSVAKICCYKVTVSDGIVTMMTPYVDSNLIVHIDQLGNQVEAIAPYEVHESVSAGETEVVFLNVPEGITITTLVKDLEGHIIEHNTTKNEDIVRIMFEPLEYAADVSLSVN